MSLLSSQPIFLCRLTDQADEEILTSTLVDEVLEVAAGAERGLLSDGLFVAFQAPGAQCPNRGDGLTVLQIKAGSNSIQS